MNSATSRVAALVAASVGVAAAACLGWVWLRSVRRAEGGGRETPAERFERLQERFAVARELRLSGDAAGFVVALAELEAELGEPERHDRLTEEVRYGGQAPPADELDRWQRRVELALQSQRPDPEREGLARLRLDKKQRT